ncbi:unnamed protein product, partial [Closterium sp. NIES-53]
IRGARAGRPAGGGAAGGGVRRAARLSCSGGGASGGECRLGKAQLASHRGGCSWAVWSREAA